MPSQLQRLAKPFPDKFVHKNPSGGGTYAKQSTYNQKALVALNGTFDFAVTEIVRGDVPDVKRDPNGKSDRAKTGAPALSGVVVGALCTLACEVDGRPTTITEVGEVEDPHNWKHDGQRLKDAASDGLKRCLARIGVGLHLRDEAEYFLERELATNAEKLAENSLPPVRVYDPDDPERPFVPPQNTSLPLVDRAVVNAIVDASDEERMGQVPMALDEAQAIADSADRRPYKNTAAL